MPKPFTPMIVTSFKGENDTSPPTEIDDQQGASVQNFYIVNGGLERRLGGSLINSGSSSSIIRGLTWCRLPASSPVERVVGVNAGQLWDFWNAGVVTAPTSLGLLGDLSSPFATTAVDHELAVLDNVLYAGNGTDPMIRYNGTNVRKSGSAAPTTVPTFNAFVAAGVLTGDVSYKLVYLDASGHESEPTATSATLSPVAQNITLNIANDTDGDRSGKNLYRRGPSSTEYRLVNASPISATATTYTDSTTDANLGQILVTGNTLFPPCQRIWEHDNRLFGCGNATDPTTLFISNEFEPWYCPASPDLSDPTQGVRLKIQARNAVIIGGISHGGYCFIFTDEGGYILQGTSADDYRIERFCNHGCTSHRSIKSLRNWLFWVGPDGVYRYDGEKTERIDDDIRTYFTARTAANLASVSSWVYDNRYYLSFPTGVNAVKCFDTRHDAWSTMRYPDVYRCATSSASQSSSPGVPRVFAVNDFDNRVVQLEKPAVFTDARCDGSGSDNILMVWISKVFNMGLNGRDKRVHLWGFKVRNPTSLTGTLSISTALLVGGQSTNTISAGTAIQVASSSVTTTSTGDDLAITPTASRLTIIRTEAFENARSELFQLYITGSATTLSDFRILEAELYWSVAS